MTASEIHLLLTGDELMSGDTVDSNSSMIAQALAAQGHTVAFLGSDWDGCEYPLDSRIQILEEPHARYATVYQDARLVCSVAAQEGGPVSFLEGLACGCLMVSAPTGFIGDLHLSEVACWTLPLPAPPQEWADTIDHLLRTVEGPSEQQQAQRDIILNQQAEMGRINAFYDTELARLRKLWAGATPGSLEADPPSAAASAGR